MKNLKKTIYCIFTVAVLLGLFGCSKKTPKVVKNDDSTLTITRIDEDGKAIRFNKKYGGFDNVTVVDLKLSTKNNPISVSLADYENIALYLEFDCEMLVENPNASTTEITWMINEISAGLPQLYNEKVPSGEWVKVSNKMFLVLGAKRSLYVSGSTLDKENTKIYIKNFSLKLSGDGLGEQKFEALNWMEAPSLKEAYKDYFDYFGLAVTYNEELSRKQVQQGLAYHADCITMGNEFKPDFIFAWNRPSQFTDFTGEDGKSYKVPEIPPKFSIADRCLNVCMKNGLKMRGHVLVWHSQTPEWFFYEDWGSTGSTELVSINEMNARMEWYIKTVLTHIKEWEDANNNGERIITTWDVVNEAISDNANDSAWVRPESSSRWTKIYKDETYIINAFRYANKYAPKDVKLAYNDYGCYSKQKRKAICKLIDEIKATPDARIDVIGMQSHVKVDYPAITGKDSFEETVQMFAEKGVNVQITELDIANGKSPNNDMRLKAIYNQYYNMFIRNRKTADKNGIEGVTIWGLNDEGTWLNAQEEHKGNTQYPLLFRNSFTCKPAFYGVLEAAQK